MPNDINHFIIEGIDNIGKGTLIKNIQNMYGYFHYIHYEKPIKSIAYNNSTIKWQEESFRQGFHLLTTHVRTIYDRFHLGECVYSPLYRDVDGEYVFKLEREYIYPRMGKAQDTTRMILLTTSNFDIIIDDGLSFNKDAKEKEQQLFINAFDKSIIDNKVIIDVHDGNGNFKTPEQIFNESINNEAKLDLNKLTF